jgi:membrane protein YdbS with pleckstrin-like domain
MQDFSNALVVIDDVPTIEGITYQPLQPEYLKIQRIWFFILMPLLAIVLFVGFYFIEKIQILWLMASVSLAYVLLALVYWVGEGLSFRHSGYAVREHDILFRSGWWVRSTHLVPFNRVQHLSIEAGMLERRYGLASISVYTAGQADLTVHGITQETAEKIKEFVGKQIKNKEAEAIEEDTKIETKDDTDEPENL